MILDTILILVVLINLWLLGASRIEACVHIAAVQGILLGLLAVLEHRGDLSVSVWLVAVAGAVLKGVVFPWLLLRALRSAEVLREFEPFVGPNASLLAGVAALGMSLWLAHRLPLPQTSQSSLLVAVSFFSILAGLFLIVARKKAISQVLGFLVMENGIYTFGVGVVRQSPVLVELAVMLDVFVAVFVMGITIFHISREFDHINAFELTTLKD